MCIYEAARCKRARSGRYLNTANNYMNDKICVERTGTCQNDTTQTEKKQWTLISMQPSWSCGDLYQIKLKDFPFPDCPLCSLCSQARANKKRKRAEEDASDESSRAGTPIGFGLVRRVTFGETAMQRAIAVRLRRVLSLRAGMGNGEWGMGNGDDGRRKRMVGGGKGKGKGPWV